MITKYKIAILRVLIDNAEKSKAGYFWSSTRFISTDLSAYYGVSLLPESVERYVQHLRAEGYIDGFTEPLTHKRLDLSEPCPNLKVTDKGVEYLRLIGF